MSISPIMAYTADRRAKDPERQKITALLYDALVKVQFNDDLLRGRTSEPPKHGKDPEKAIYKILYHSYVTAQDGKVHKNFKGFLCNTYIIYKGVFLSDFVQI